MYLGVKRRYINTLPFLSFPLCAPRPYETRRKPRLSLTSTLARAPVVGGAVAMTTGHPGLGEGAVAGRQRRRVVEQPERGRVVSDGARDRKQRRPKQPVRRRATEVRRQRQVFVSAEQTPDAPRRVLVSRRTVLTNTHGFHTHPMSPS